MTSGKSENLWFEKTTWLKKIAREIASKIRELLLSAFQYNQLRARGLLECVHYLPLQFHRSRGGIDLRAGRDSLTMRLLREAVVLSSCAKQVSWYYWASSWLHTCADDLASLVPVTLFKHHRLCFYFHPRERWRNRARLNWTEHSSFNLTVRLFLIYLQTSWCWRISPRSFKSPAY